MASGAADQDDNISITSTAASEERDQYLVDRIVGERDVEGVREYLVMWEGYPDYRCTWEPEDNFDGGDTIPAWEHVKMRVTRGLETAFNVPALERKINEWEEATAFRKLRRREKRKKLGIPVAESEEEEEQVEDEDDPAEDDSEQNQFSNKEKSGVPNPTQIKQRRVSRVLESSSDRDDTVQRMHSPESVASGSSKSENEPTLYQQRDLARAVNKVSYQGTQRPSKTSVEKVKSIPNLSDKSSPASHNVPPNRTVRETERKVADGSFRTEKAPKPATSFTMPLLEPQSRRSSIEMPQKKTSKPHSSKPQPIVDTSVGPPATTNVPKKRGRPLGWRKNPDKDSQQSRVGVKSALPSIKRKVTGSVISKNWNQPVAKKRLSFATAGSIATNPNSFSAKNQSRFQNLATQHKFAKASRNEPPPRIEDLVLYNAKDGPPKPGEKRLTPFQMIQAGITPEASNSTSLVEEGQGLRRVSFAKSLESAKSQLKLKLPLTIDTRKTVSSTEPKSATVSPANTAVGVRETVAFAEPEDRNISATLAKANSPTTQKSYDGPLAIKTQPKPTTFSGMNKAAKSSATQDSGIRRTVTFKEPEKMDKSTDSPSIELAGEPLGPGATTIERPPKKSSISPSTPEIQSSTSVLKRRESDALIHRDAMDLSPDYEPPEGTFNHSASRSISDARTLINSWGFQNPPSRRPDPTTRKVSIGDQVDQSSGVSRSLEDPARTSAVEERPLAIQGHQQIATEGSLHGIAHNEDMRTLEKAEILPWSQIQGNTSQTVHRCTVFGAIFKGEQFLIPAAFVGLPFLVRCLLLEIKVGPKDLNIHLRHRCAAADYQKYFHTEEPFYYGAGHVNVFEGRQPKVDELAHDLKMHGFGALFFCKEFSMLVYPTETAEWAFLDKHYIPEVKLPVSLRCVVFRSIPEFFDDKTGELSIKNDSLKLVDDAPLMNRLFRETFGLEYKALVSREKKGSDVDHDTFFIIYPSFKEDEHDLIVSFLEANNATVYSSYTTGAWDYVLKEVHDAIILIHTQSPALHTIPSLYRAALTNRTIYHPMFHITLDLSFSPPELETPQRLIKLFPSGGAILLTDSFLLTQTEQAVRILEWFVYYILPTKCPGSWKLSLRPRFREWLLNIITGLEPPKGDHFVKLYGMFSKLLPLDLMDEDTDFEIPMPNAPVVTARYISDFDESVGLGVLPNEMEIMHRNDERLVNWYAGWTRTKVYTMRRLHVVYSDSLLDKERIKPWRRLWNHLGFWTIDGCLWEHDIKKWEDERKAADIYTWEKRKRKDEKEMALRRDQEERREQERKEQERSEREEKEAELRKRQEEIEAELEREQKEKQEKETMSVNVTEVQGFGMVDLYGGD